MYIKFDENNKDTKINTGKYLCVIKGFNGFYYYNVLTYYNSLKDGIDDYDFEGKGFYDYDFEGKGFYDYDSDCGNYKVSNIIAYQPIEQYVSE